MLEKQLIPEIFCLHGAYYNGQTDFVGIHYFFCGQSKHIVMWILMIKHLSPVQQSS